jgi:hypothetical protein
MRDIVMSVLSLVRLPYPLTTRKITRVRVGRQTFVEAEFKGPNLPTLRYTFFLRAFTVREIHRLEVPIPWRLIKDPMVQNSRKILIGTEFGRSAEKWLIKNHVAGWWVPYVWKPVLRKFKNRIKVQVSDKNLEVFDKIRERIETWLKGLANRLKREYKGFFPEEPSKIVFLADFLEEPTNAPGPPGP